MIGAGTGGAIIQSNTHRDVSSHPEFKVSRTPKGHGAFRPDIEGLRAVAVIMVVAFHGGIRAFSGGFIGVDIFFVMSGYLITGILARELQETGTLSFVEFYARRSRRLIPASVVMVLAVIGLCTLLLPLIDEKPVWKASMTVVTYLSNIWFMFTGIDYFSHQAAAINPLLHTWSLSVEEQFYFVWPSLLVLGYRWSRRRIWSISLLVAVSVLSFIGSLILQSHAQAYAFFLLPARFWEFGVGGLLVYAPASLKRSFAAHAGVLSWSGLALLVLAATLYTGETVFPGTAVLLPVAGTLMLLASGATLAPASASRLLALPPFQYIGGLSYSIYLWHWPILVLFEMRTPSRVRLLVCVAATLLVSDLTHRLIENPIRFSKSLKTHPRQSIVMMAGLSLLALVATTAWWQVEARRSTRDPYVDAAKDNLKLSHPACLVLQTSLQAEGCNLGDPSGSKTIVLFGDSHAWHWAPTLDVLGAQRHWRVITLAKASCPSEAIESLWNDALSRPYAECSVWRNKVLQRIAELHPALVVLSSDSDYRSGPHAGQALTYGQWRGGYDTTLRQLNAQHVPVLVLADVPNFPYDVPVCLAWAAKSGKPCAALDPKDAFNAVKSQAELDSVRSTPGTSIVNLSSTLCRNGKCDPAQDGVILYTDHNHLTATYARKLASSLAAGLDKTGALD
jgi:peptidoglycan/LPS O-acetylase OafA/YrhL